MDIKVASVDTIAICIEAKKGKFPHWLLAMISLVQIMCELLDHTLL